MHANTMAEVRAARAELARLEALLRREQARAIGRCNRVSRIVIGSGSGRHVFALDRDWGALHAAAADITRFLFPTPGRLHKARRRGERALAAHGAA